MCNFIDLCQNCITNEWKKQLDEPAPLGSIVEVYTPGCLVELRLLFGSSVPKNAWWREWVGPENAEEV